MTDQMIFDKVWTHFVINGEPMSINRYESCVYRGPKGEKCAIGVLIPDELYHSSMEGKSIEGRNRHNHHTAAALWDYLGLEDERREALLVALQKAHDYAAVSATITGFTETITAQLELIAENLELDVPS